MPKFWGVQCCLSFVTTHWLQEELPRARNSKYQHWESLAGIATGFCCLDTPVVLIWSAPGTSLSQFLLLSFEKTAFLRKALGRPSSFPIALLFLHESIFCRLSLLILSSLMLSYRSEYISHAHNFAILSHYSLFSRSDLPFFNYYCYFYAASTAVNAFPIVTCI